MTEHQIVCVVCGHEASVSSVWKTHNPFTCMSKVCNNVFNNLPDDITNQFHASIDTLHSDRGNYYSSVDDLVEIDLEVDFSYYRYEKRFYEGFGQVFINETLQGIDLWGDYSEWIMANSEIDHGSHYYVVGGTRIDYQYTRARVILSEKIIPKKKQDHIDKTINELIGFERAKSMTDEIKRICKQRDINTFFCNSCYEFKGLKISKTYYRI